MQEYNKKEKRELLYLINKIQRFEFNHIRKWKIKPSNEEIASNLNISIEKIAEVKEFINYLNKEDEELKLKSKCHTKEDVLEAKKIRNLKYNNI